jgi:hypothetical protein
VPQNFLSPQRDQPLLLPVDMCEWLPPAGAGGRDEVDARHRKRPARRLPATTSPPPAANTAARTGFPARFSISESSTGRKFIVGKETFLAILAHDAQHMQLGAHLGEADGEPADAGA